MGSEFGKGFPDLTRPIFAKFEAAEKLGYAVPITDFQVFVKCQGLLIETYFTGNFNPLGGIDGKFEAIHNSVHEVTRQILDGRRTAMMNRAEGPTALHVSSRSFADFVLPNLQMNKLDITMALLYEVDEVALPFASHLHLRGHIGVPDDHPMAAKHVDLYSANEFAFLLRKARDTRTAATHPVDEKFDGIQWQGFGEASHYFSILPVAGSAGKLYGILVVGANPRRPIDDDHYRFMRDLSSFATAIAASKDTVEEAKKRRQSLEKKIAQSEKEIRFMAQNASVGMLLSLPTGEVQWANEQYYKLTGRPEQDKIKSRLTYLDCFIDVDYPRAQASWAQVLSGQPTEGVELRMKRLFVPPLGDPEPSCILAHSFPYLENGKVVSIMTIIQDISALRWAEKMEARKALIAAEEKQKTKEFLDVVSHEIRNPLSAICSSADMIIKSLAKAQLEDADKSNLRTALKDNVDHANVIISAAKMQKRIVDDILTLSKLQYELLSIKPQPMQLPRLVETTVKMYESDMRAHSVESISIPEPSLKNNCVDWVLCDPDRLTQILANFLTNAIKFTKNEANRQIVVRCGVATSEPRKAFSPDILWAPVDPEGSISTSELSIKSSKCTSNHHGHIETSNQDLSDRSQLYLIITVQDTGVGMTDKERQKLFKRFAQASETTSIQFGGSGLGLFISKRLTEKMGGEIGVSSKPGSGSTFAFYVQAERTELKSSNTIIDPQFSPAARTMSVPADGDFPISSGHIHVLVVEDNELNQKVLVKILTNASCVVSVASDGAEALRQLKASDLSLGNQSGQHFDMVLMDWEMPVMDGLTACREIRAMERDGRFVRHIEIIISTGNATQDHNDTAVIAGADAVMSKPLHPDELLSQMRTRLSAFSSATTPPPTNRTFSEP
jgi:signal transduction histidine kinase/CheY-like chemotaxis protein